MKVIYLTSRSLCKKGVAALYEMLNTSTNVSDLDMNIIERYDVTKVQIHNVVSLNEKDNLFIVNYDFEDGWHIKLKLEEIYGEDILKSNDIPCVIFGKGYGIVEDCGDPDSLMQIAKTSNLKSVDLTHFDKNELNDMLLSNMSHFQTIYECE